MPVSTTGGGPSRGGIFVPTIISGLAFWLDSSDAATLFQDDALTTPATDDGHVIGGWKDKSGNNYHVTQALLAKKPTLQSGVGDTINGHPVIRFDGTDDLLVRTIANFLAAASAGAIFAVYRMTAALLDNETLFASCDTASTTRFVAFRGRSSAASNSITILQQNNEGAIDQVVTTTPVVADISYIGAVFADGTTWRLSLNGTYLAKVVSTGADSGDWFADTPTTRDNISVGGRKDSSGEARFLKGDLAELLIYGALTDAEIDLIESYLASRYGIVMIDNDFEGGNGSVVIT